MRRRFPSTASVRLARESGTPRSVACCIARSVPCTIMRRGSIATATVPCRPPCAGIALPRYGCSPSNVPRYAPYATKRCAENRPSPEKSPHGPDARNELIAVLAIVPPNTAAIRSKRTPEIVVSLPATRPASTMWLPEPPPASVMPTELPSIGGMAGSDRPGNAAYRGARMRRPLDASQKALVSCGRSSA